MKEKQKEYWNNKHQNHQWDKYIHYSEFESNDLHKSNFEKGIKNSTENLTQLLLKNTSIFSFANNVKALDFGCGKGDLLLELEKNFPKFNGVGIDISENAIDYLNNEISDKRLTGRIEAHIGSIEVLNELSQTEHYTYDLIICRDVFYLLTKKEQISFFEYANILLKNTGVLYISDCIVKNTIVNEYKDLVLKRQYGHSPLTWYQNKSSIVFSIDDFLSNSFETKEIIINEDAVYKSFKTASMFTQNEEVKNKYNLISKLAKNEKPDNYNLIYGKFIFKKLTRIPNKIDNQIKIKLQKNICFKKNETLISSGEYFIEKNKWNIIIGRSGFGKTTLLNYIGNWHKDCLIKIENNYKKIFLLEQNPQLIEDLSVFSNLLIFNNDKSKIYEVTNNLGIPNVLLERNLKSGAFSGGEYQRIALAQAILSEPELLLLDEPCTGMDQINKYSFFSTLRNYYKTTDNQTPTIIVVDHEFNLIKSFFDNFYELIHQNIFRIEK